jgi:hypothetical protein
MDMLEVSATLFVLAALGGIGLAAIRLAGRRNPPVWFAMAHGLLATAGFTLLAYAVWATTVPMLATWSLLLMAVAAAGGAWMHLGYHVRQLLLPPAWVFGHAALAALGLLLLLIAVLG